MNKFGILVLSAIVTFILYVLVGTCERVDEIKEMAPADMESKNWEIMRYEGWQYGSLNNHGGKVWYHVKNKDDASIQYRVYVTLWGGELHYTYGQPEKLERSNVDIELKSSEITGSK